MLIITPYGRIIQRRRARHLRYALLRRYLIETLCGVALGIICAAALLAALLTVANPPC